MKALLLLGLALLFVSGCHLACITGDCPGPTPPTCNREKVDSVGGGYTVAFTTTDCHIRVVRLAPERAAP